MIRTNKRTNGEPAMVILPVVNPRATREEAMAAIGDADTYAQYVDQLPGTNRDPILLAKLQRGVQNRHSSRLLKGQRRRNTLPLR